MSIAREQVPTYWLIRHGRRFFSSSAFLAAATCSATATDFLASAIRNATARFFVGGCSADTAVLATVTFGATRCCFGLAFCMARPAAFFRWSLPTFGNQMGWISLAHVF